MLLDNAPIVYRSIPPIILISSLFVAMRVVRLTFDISRAVVEELEIEQHDENEVRFNVSGVITGVDADKLRKALTAKDVEPVSLTIETGYDEDTASD